MSIGTGVFLIVLGAILTFALEGDFGGGVVNLDMVGYILMLGGLLTLIIGATALLKRRRSISTSRAVVDPATGERVTQHETARSGAPLV